MVAFIACGSWPHKGRQYEVMNLRCDILPILSQIDDGVTITVRSKPHNATGLRASAASHTLHPANVRHLIGGEVWYIDTGTYPAHAALVKGGWVYDSIYTRRVSKQNYKGEFKFIMRAE